jgi:hypothetical protein
MYNLVYALQTNEEIIQSWYEGKLLFKHCIDKLIKDATNHAYNDNSINNLIITYNHHCITKQEYCLGLYDITKFQMLHQSYSKAF